MKNKNKLALSAALLSAGILTGCGGTDGTISDYNDRNDDGYNNTSSNIDNNNSVLAIIKAVLDYTFFFSR